MEVFRPTTVVMVQSLPAVGLLLLLLVGAGWWSAALLLPEDETVEFVGRTVAERERVAVRADGGTGVEEEEGVLEGVERAVPSAERAVFRCMGVDGLDVIMGGEEEEEEVEAAGVCKGAEGG